MSISPTLFDRCEGGEHRIHIGPRNLIEARQQLAAAYAEMNRRNALLTSGPVDQRFWPADDTLRLVVEHTPVLALDAECLGYLEDIAYRGRCAGVHITLRAAPQPPGAVLVAGLPPLGLPRALSEAVEAYLIEVDAEPADRYAAACN